MENLKTFGPWAIALGLVYLASSLVFVGREAGALRSEIRAAVAGAETMPDTHPVLSRLDKALIELPLMTEEIKSIREEIPVILEETAAIRALVPDILNEVKDVRAAIVPVLAESAALRADVPVVIESAKELVGGAKEVSKGIGKGAAQGAVEGTVKGIISAPFEVIKQGADLIIPDGPAEPEPEPVASEPDE